MAKQVVWTCLPHGLDSSGAYLLSVYASIHPGITDSFAPTGVWVEWTKQLRNLSDLLVLKFALVSATGVPAQDNGGKHALMRDAKLDDAYWEAIFHANRAKSDAYKDGYKAGYLSLASLLNCASAKTAKVIRQNLDEALSKAARGIEESGPTAQFSVETPPEFQWYRWQENARNSSRPDATLDATIIDGFRSWLQTYLPIADSTSTPPDPNLAVRTTARRAERFLYRISSTPFSSLSAPVFIFVKELSGAILNQPEQDYLRQLERTVDVDAMRSLLRTAIYHSAIPKQTDSGRGPRAEVKDMDDPDKQPFSERPFPEQLAIVGNYSPLLRKLGLVFDVVVPKEQVAGYNLVSLIVSDPSIDWLVSPYTQFNGNSFYPSPEPPLHKNGFLQVGDSSHFTFETIDVDGATLRQLSHFQTADTIGQNADNQSVGPPESTSFPVPRSTGVALLIHDRDQLIKDEVARQERMRNTLSDSTILTAADLIRSYEPEVRLLGFPVGLSELSASDSCEPRPAVSLPSAWLSLGLRNEAYTFKKASPSGTNLDFSEDKVRSGIRLALRKVRDQLGSKGVADDFEVSDMLFRWSGWSLVVDSPFKGTGPDETGTPPDRPFQLQLTLPNATLPVLGYLGRYRIRVRGRNLAGGPLGPDDSTDSSTLSPEITFVRTEAIPPLPVLLTSSLEAKKSPGENIERLVVRTGRQFQNDSCRRCLIPPRTSFEIAERHGKFFKSPPQNTGSFAEVALCSDGSVPIDTGSCNPIWKPRSSDPLPCQYLPDPLGEYVTFSLEDLSVPKGETGATVSIPAMHLYAGRQWPNARRLLVRLKKGKKIKAKWATAHPQGIFSEGVPELVVTLPTAKVVGLHFSAGVSADSREQHYGANRLWVQKVQKHHGGEEVQVATNPLVTPARTLMLVHAVDESLDKPKLTAVGATRSLGDNKVKLSLQFEDEPLSTGQVDFSASWTDVVDDLALCPDKIPAHYPSLAPVCSQRVDDLIGKHTVSGVIEQFPDTKYRRVIYGATALSKFGEYFQGEKQTGSEEHDVQEDNREGDDPSKYRLDIWNSAPPPPIEVAYILPTFLWSKDATAVGGNEIKHSYQSKRFGGRLRVFLKRPWYASGEGEQVGVVLWADSAENDTYQLLPAADSSWPAPRENAPMTISDPNYRNTTRHVVTRWGADPTWLTHMDSLAPTANDFASGVMEKRVALQELVDPKEVIPKLPVSLIKYDVEFDVENQLWYFDVNFCNVPAYFCFVRLALVRYQPNSLRFAECSSVVLADFMQLTPDRSVTVFRACKETGSSPPCRRSTDSLTVQLCGIKNDRPNTYEIEIEKRIELASGAFTWIPARYTVDETAKGIAEPNVLKSWRVTLDDLRGHKRLVVREFEKHQSDANVDDRRLVFADVLDMPDF